MQGHVYDIEQPGEPCEFIIITECTRDCTRKTHDNVKLYEETLTEFKEIQLTEPDDPEENLRVLFKLQLDAKEYYKNIAYGETIRTPRKENKQNIT